MNVAPQTLLFFYACLLGGVLGACYDIFRILRIAFPPGKAAVFIQDLLFSFLALILLFFFFQATTAGSVRIFVFVGAFAGFILYYLTIGALIIKLATKIIHIIKRVLSFFARLFIRPLARLFRFILRKLNSLLRPWVGKMKKNCNSLKKHLLSAPTSLYNKDKSKKRKRVKQNEKSKIFFKRKKKKKKFSPF